jgi:CRP/FNR family transcriptional regulator, cyclic AMP receptor protein
MSLFPDTAVFQERLAALPLAIYQAGETVLTAGSTTGRLLILEQGSVAIVKEGVEIAEVATPGAVFGELSVLLEQPHTAEVRALETAQFRVADAAALLARDPIALLYVAAVLARRLDGANQALIEVRRQLEAGQPRHVIGKTVEKMEELVAASSAGVVYAGHEKWQQAFRIKEACLALIKKHGRREENIKGIQVMSSNVNDFTVWFSSFGSQLHVLDIWNDGADGTKVANLQWSHADHLTIVIFRRGLWEKELLELAEMCL